MKSIIYRILINSLNSLPFRNILAHIIRKLKFLPLDKFYRDFKILGQFQVEIGGGQYFKMIGYGGQIENETFWKGLFKSFENDTGWIFKELCKYSNTIVDIGANTGIYSLIAKSINSNTEIFAFEPAEGTYYKLLKNNQVNDFDIVCEKIALSNHNGKSVFYDVPDKNQTSASLSGRKLKNWDGYNGLINEYEVLVQTFDSYVKEKNIQNVDLVKIDVEMHEPEVLQGMIESIKHFKPYILVEVLEDDIGETIENYFDEDWLFFHLKNENELVKTEKIRRVDYLWNYFLVHKDRYEPISELIQKYICH